jgi:transcriptional regulator with XRE-family HTH domain
LRKLINSWLTLGLFWRMIGRLGHRKPAGREANCMTEALNPDSSLDELFPFVPKSEGEAQEVQKPKQAIAKVGYSHKGMIDLIIANRGISQNALAAHFGYSPSWISQVMSSDAFIAAMAERSAEIEDPTLRATVEEGMKGLVHRSMEILKAKLNAEPSAVSDQLALRTLELGSRALGMGARDAAINVQVNVGEHLEKLGGRMTGLLARKRQEALVDSQNPLPTNPLLESQQS